jgi:(5-formylfuran-3-yl)methyl phosphate synthase
MTTRLLIGVRSIAEASASIHNGAEIIDIIEPIRGSFPMASPETMRAIAREVPPRFPVGASMGQWMDWRASGRFPDLPSGLSYVEIGLSGAGDLDGWREELNRFRAEVCARQELHLEAAWVAVAYADWREARAPRPAEVLDFAAGNGFPIFHLDTFSKEGGATAGGLFDRMCPAEVRSIVDSARRRGLEVFLSGAIGIEQLDQALAIEPDAIAIRSAACSGGFRGSPIDPRAVDAFAKKLSVATVQ